MVKKKHEQLHHQVMQLLRVLNNMEKRIKTRFFRTDVENKVWGHAKKPTNIQLLCCLQEPCFSGGFR